MLIDVLGAAGLDAMAQVGPRQPRATAPSGLSRSSSMSYAVARAIVTLARGRARCRTARRTIYMQAIHAGRAYARADRQVELVERPPMTELA